MDLGFTLGIQPEMRRIPRKPVSPGNPKEGRAELQGIAGGMVVMPREIAYFVRPATV